MQTQKSAAILQLIEDLGQEEYASGVVLRELIRYLNVDTLNDFVATFKRNHDMEENKLAVDSDDITEDFDAPGPGYEEFDLCMKCQDSYDVSKPHVCDASSRYFSSLIPAC